MYKGEVMSLQKLNKINISDNLKRIILEKSKALTEKYNTPLDDAIRIMYNTFTVPSYDGGQKAYT